MVTDGHARTVWIATEFSIDDGGRAWIQAATTPDRAKELCQQHHEQHGGDTALNWHVDEAAKWMFGQDTEAARTTGNDHYEIRRVEVEP